MKLNKIYAFIDDNKNSIKIASTIMGVSLLISGIFSHTFINTGILGYLIFLTLNTTENYQELQGINLLKRWTCYATFITLENLGNMMITQFYNSVLYNVAKIFVLGILLQDEQNIVLYYNHILDYYKKANIQSSQILNTFKIDLKQKSKDYNIYNWITSFFVKEKKQ